MVLETYRGTRFLRYFSDCDWQQEHVERYAYAWKIVKKKAFPVLFLTAFPINTLKYLYLLDPFRDHLFILMELNMNIIALSSYFGLGPAHKLWVILDWDKWNESTMKKLIFMSVSFEGAIKNEWIKIWHSLLFTFNGWLGFNLTRALDLGRGALKLLASLPPKQHLPQRH